MQVLLSGNGILINGLRVLRASVANVRVSKPLIRVVPLARLQAKHSRFATSQT